MIAHPAFPAERWSVRETTLDLDLLGQTQSVFALANGHIGVRTNLDEGAPVAIPGTYLNSFYELRPLPYAESGYGYPESGQTIVNVTNGKLIRLLVDDEPFDVRYGRLVAHERELDLRDGVLRRSAHWISPTGTAIRLRSTGLVSFTQRALRTAAAHLHRAQGRRGRTPLARPDARPRPRTGAPARTRKRCLSLANDPRPGKLPATGPPARPLFTSAPTSPSARGTLAGATLPAAATCRLPG
jgi:Glycosyl hydrolase family 65, N-terminal domain